MDDRSREIKKKIIVAMVVIFVVLTLILPYLAPNDPLQTNFANVLKPPSGDYLFGTDQVGRCVLSRVMYGARISIGMVTLMLSMLSALGVTIGTIAGMSSRTIDTIIMRLSDTILAFPDMVLAIAIVGIIGPGLLNTVIALSIIWWTKYARLTRVLIIENYSKEYIDSALMAGASKLKIVVKYIYPNILPQILSHLMLDVGSMLLTISSLSFLGLGIQPPTPEWGNMLNEGRVYLQTAPWLLIYPGMAIFISVAIFNIIGDIARDVLDPSGL